MIDPRDVGAAAAAVLATAGHDGGDLRTHRPAGNHLCRDGGGTLGRNRP